MKETSRKKSFLEVFIRIKNIVFAVLLALIVAVIVFTMIVRISGNSPSLLGYSVYRVSSGSMAPELEVGDVILSHEVDPMTLKKGDIISYIGEIGNEKDVIITHRVIRAPFKNEGEYFIQTKGDAASVEDNPFSLDKVKGIYVQRIDILKDLYNFFATPWGLVTIIVLIIVAFLGEIINIIKAALNIGESKESLDDIITRVQEREKSSDENLPDGDTEIIDETKIDDK